MVDHAMLRQQAMWAYELGRLRRASRITFAVAPLVVVPLWETGNVLPILSLGLVLAAASVSARWWDRRRGDDVTIGLLAGLLPLGISLAVCHIGASCNATVSVVLCGSAGAISGFALERHADRDQAGRLARWLTSAPVLILTASLACGAINAGAIIGIVVGISGASLLGAVVRSVRTSWQSYR